MWLLLAAAAAPAAAAEASWASWAFGEVTAGAGAAKSWVGDLSWDGLSSAVDAASLGVLPDMPLPSLGDVTDQLTQLHGTVTWLAREIQRVVIIAFKVLICVLFWRLTGSPRRAFFCWVVCNLLGPARLWACVCFLTRWSLWLVDESAGSAFVLAACFILGELGLVRWDLVLQWLKRKAAMACDVTGDGQFDHEDVAHLACRAASRVAKGLDANGDGKFDHHDVAAALGHVGRAMASPFRRSEDPPEPVAFAASGAVTSPPTSPKLQRGAARSDLDEAMELLQPDTRAVTNATLARAG